MRLMLTIAFDILDRKKEATFEELFNEVKKEQNAVWKEYFKGEDEQSIWTRKQGELFTYLTTDGRFIVNEHNKWSLIKHYSFDDIKKMRVNVGELPVEEDEE